MELRPARNVVCRTQVKDKIQSMLADEEQQRRLDMEMEVERLRALDAYANRDVQRRQEQRRGAEILREQLAERERQREREEDLKDMVRQRQDATCLTVLDVLRIAWQYAQQHAADGIDLSHVLSQQHSAACQTAPRRAADGIAVV